MDYCHPCQRHLNGALACPGCGTPARAAAEAPPAYARAGAGETLGYGVPQQYEAQQYEAQPYGTQQYEGQPYGAQPYGSPEYRVPQQYEPAGPQDAAWTGEQEPQEEWDPGAEPGTEAPSVDDPDPENDPDAETDPDDEPGGRAARRRARGAAAVGPGDADASRRDRKAAAHRRRRRRTVLITAGFVLAAGSLGLAELGTDAPFSPFSSGQPDPAGDTAADGGTSSPSPGATADPVSDTSGATPGAAGSASPDASASASKSPKDKHSKSPDAKDTGKAQQTGAPGSGTTP
ncbi:SCO2400 family protein, partial [Streptomyces puniciscabiei]